MFIFLFFWSRNQENLHFPYEKLTFSYLKSFNPYKNKGFSNFFLDFFDFFDFLDFLDFLDFRVRCFFTWLRILKYWGMTFNFERSLIPQTRLWSIAMSQRRDVEMSSTSRRRGHDRQIRKKLGSRYELQNCRAKVQAIHPKTDRRKRRPCIARWPTESVGHTLQDS